MFRYKRSVGGSRERQGYIFYTSRNYRNLAPRQRRKIENLCREAGGEYYQALFQFVTTASGAEEICMRECLSRSTLERVVKKYYEIFPGRI